MLEIKNIVKKYADHLALDDVSMNVPSGKIFGLLGPNGAGKTSLIRIINQITAPDEGEIFIHGEKLSQHHIGQIGYLPEERGLYKKMKVGEQMIYLAQLKGLSRTQAREKLIYWFDRLQMDNWWNKKIEDLSKGMQQKVQFISTVMHDPKLIILDEPFSGFDPVNAQLIQDEILELNHKGATIIYSTHRMESVEELCDHIALINKSRKVLDGPLKEIKNRYNSKTFVIEYIPIGIEGASDWKQSDYFQVVDEQTTADLQQIKIQIRNGYTVNDIILQVIPHIQILQIREILPSIHDIFIQTVTNPISIHNHE